MDLTPLQKSLLNLERNQKDFETAKQIGQFQFLDSLRAGIVQNFEVTFELSWKFMKRWLERNISPEVTVAITRKELFRLAGQYGMISDVERWFGYHSVRNETSHTYNEKTAKDACECSLEFLKDAKELLSFLEKKND